MKEKVELVLNGLIEVYLHQAQPLSSTKLKEYANLPYSASSIRCYLKELEKCELIEKEHISSGSYPSVKAMKAFWSEKLKDANIDLSGLEEKAEELDIYIMIEMFENQLLTEVYNLNNKFVILEFEKDEVIFKYDENIYSFFKSVKGILLDELKKYLLHIGLKKEYEKIKKLYNYVSYNKGYIYKNDIDPKPFEKYDFERFSKGINYTGDYLVFRDMINDKNTFYHILVVGDVYKDFFEILNPGKEGIK